MSNPGTAASPKVTPRHYQAVCGLALTGLMLLQLQQSTMATHITVLVSVLIGFIGVRALIYRSRISPMLVLLTFALPYVFEQYHANQNSNPDYPNSRCLDVADVLICVAAMTYFIAHYRLNGLWFGVLPDASRRPSAGSTGNVAKPAPPIARSEESLSPGELLALVFTIPAFALLAQFALLLLAQRFSLLEMGSGLRQLVVVAWTFLLTMFLAAQAFRYWRRLQMDRVSAMLMLQDLLWHETRGEQRRISRWIAWKRLRSRK